MKKIFFSLAMIFLMGMSGQNNYPINKKLIKECQKVFSIEKPKFKEVKTDSSMLAPKKGRLYCIQDEDSTVGYSYMGKVHSCRPNGCKDPNNDPFYQDNAEYFLYFILFDTTASIQKIHIYDYQASRGHAITSKSWLKQFKNYQGEKMLTYGKDIDAVSGATISATSLIKEINYQTPILRKIILQAHSVH